MIRYRYIPFTFGKPKFQVQSSFAPSNVYFFMFISTPVSLCNNNGANVGGWPGKRRGTVTILQPMNSTTTIPASSLENILWSLAAHHYGLNDVAVTLISSGYCAVKSSFVKVSRDYYLIHGVLKVIRTLASLIYVLPRLEVAVKIL